MTILVESRRGGLVEDFAGQSRLFLLRIREIERFEDRHRGIFEFKDGFYDIGRRPSYVEVRDILALGLVGGGMKDPDVQEVFLQITPADFDRMYVLAQAVVGAAFHPDLAEAAKDASTKKDQPRHVSTHEGSLEN